MTISFLVFTFGIYILGENISSFKVPVFACPINTEGTIEGACYTLAHLNTFFTSNSTIKILEFFGVTVLFIVIFGRMLCGFFCPFGFIQDIVYKIKESFKLKSFRFEEKNLPMIKVIKWGILFIFFGVCLFGINFCEICPVVAFTPAIAGAVVTLKVSFFVAIITIVGSFFKRRFWCNICPLGLFIGIFHRFSFFKLKKDCQACTECGACYEACPMEIKSIYTEREKTNITTTDCLFCSECVKVCPEDKAISITCLGKKVYESSREDFFDNNK
jgi:polyferredoxin